MNDSPGWASPGSDNSETPPADAPDAPGLPRQAGPPSPPPQDAPDADQPDRTGPAGEHSDAAVPAAPEGSEPAAPAEAPQQPPVPPGPVAPNWSATQPPAAPWGHNPPPGPGQPVPPPPPGPNAGMGGAPYPGGPYPGGPYPGGPYPGGPYPGGPYPGGPYPGPPQPGWGWAGGPHPRWTAPPPPKPGVIPLRPLDVGDIAGGAFAVIRVHWRKVLAISFAVSLVLEILQMIFSRYVWNGSIRMPDESQPSMAALEHFYRDAAPAILGSTALSTLAAIVAVPLLTVIVSRSILGRPVDIGEVWREARSRMPWLLGLMLSMAVVLTLLMAICVLPGAAVTVAGSTAGGAGLTVLGALAGGCLVLWLVVPFSLSIPTLLLERQGIVASVSRAYKLVRGSWWRVLGVLLLGLLLTAVLGALIQYPFVAISELANGTAGTGSSSMLSLYNSTGTGFSILLAIGSTIASTFTLPMTTGIITLLYIDRRIRTEGLDVELARAAGIEGYQGR